jgi:formate dehydrogenase subunit delta
MHSPNDTLVRMANDIGNFFRAQGEERAVVGIADHIKKFWEPRMKKQIFAHLDAGGAGLNPVTLKALEQLKTAMHGKSTAAEALAAAQAAAGSQPASAVQKSEPKKAQQQQPAQQPKAKAGRGGGKR